MLCDLNIELTEIICIHLDMASLTNFIKTCKHTSTCLPDTFFKIYCHTLYDSIFWKRALERSRTYHSRSWKSELYKIEKFQKMVVEIEGQRWHNYEFYKLWTFQNRKKKFFPNEAFEC